MSKFEEKRQARIERMKTRAAKKHEFADNNGFDLFSEEKSGIPFGQPNVGSPARMRAQQNYRDRISAKIDRGMEARIEAERLESKIRHAENDNAIYSDDPEAVRKIKEKIKDIEESNQWSKDANKKMRPLKTWQAGFDYFSKQEDEDSKIIAEHLKTMHGFYAIPPESISRYKFGTNTAEIRRLKERLQVLENASKIEGQSFTVNNIDVKIEEGQVRVFFQGKPSEEVRKIIKSYPLSLKWSRYQTAWVRKLTASTGKYFFDELKKVLKEV